MKSIKLGDYIEIFSRKNTDEKYGVNSIRGISIQKVFTSTKANTEGLSLSNFNIVPPGYFAFNPNTARMGDKICIAYNDSNDDYIVSAIYPVFRIKDEKTINPLYLKMFFNRSEFDRYVRFNSWGSARETFNYDDFCNIILTLPSLKIQNKYVEIYSSILKSLGDYSSTFEDLKFVCDATIDKIKHVYKPVSIGNFITQTSIKNTSNLPLKFKGLSMENYFIDSIADNNYLDFSKYKIVKSGEFACVLMKVGRDCRLTIAENDSKEDYIISPAYYSFKINNINSSYFMACVSRPEFERRAWFSCDTSARGSLSWNEFCDLQIPDAPENMQIIISKIQSALISRTKICEELNGVLNNLCSVLIKGSVKEGEMEND